MDEKALEICVDKMIAALQELKNSKKVVPEIIPIRSELSSLEDVVKTDKWPQAVNPNYICNTKDVEECRQRGRGVLEMMVDEDLSDKTFLDFGCGDGYSVHAATKAKLAVGYDIAVGTAWDVNHDNRIFTTEWEKVKENGLYDAILCFDVIDHATEDPVELLLKMKEVLAQHGKIYLRCHPYTSRHAHHHYNTLNKAYVHLVFNEEELKRIDPRWGQESYQPCRKVIRPLLEYDRMFKDAGLKIASRYEIKEMVPDFFKTPSVAAKIKQSLVIDDFPEFQLSLSFIDFEISHL